MTPPLVTAECQALLASLEAQRTHVLGILEGLPDEALRRPVLPSAWTCLGLVQHLALDVERFWFRAVIAGEQVDLHTGHGAWQVAPDVSAESVFDLYRQEVELANSIIAASPMEADPAWWPGELFSDLPRRNVRQTILAVIVETACHAGHLDAARELIDGTSWLILT